MDLPTYTSIWRIEKRLYKLYDFRLPMPLPIGQVTVFAAVTVPYVVLLTVLGLPFNHTLIWLYVLPPGLATWLVTRPVLESKRLPELIRSQLRYLAEPRILCRMTPLSERDVVVVTGRIWRPRESRERFLAAGDAGGEMAAGEMAHVAAEPPATRGRLPRGPLPPGRQRDRAREVRRMDPADWLAASSRSAEPFMSAEAGAPQASVPPAGVREPAAGAGRARPGMPAVADVPAAAGAPAQGDQRPRPTMGVTPIALGGGGCHTHSVSAADTGEPSADVVWHARSAEEPTAAQSAVAAHAHPAQAATGPTGPTGLTGAPELAGARQQAGPPESAGPESAGPESAGARELAGPELAELAGPEWAGPELAEPAGAPELAGLAGPPELGGPLAPGGPPGPAGALRPVVTVVGAHAATTAAPPVERALAGPSARRGDLRARRVAVVPGGHRPGKPDLLQRDRARARQPIGIKPRIVVLGCTAGAGQTVTTLLTGEVLSSLRQDQVAVMDLNPGPGSLARRAEARPAPSQAALTGRSRLVVIGPRAAAGGNQAAATPRDPAIDAITFEAATDRYDLVFADPATVAVPRLLAVADQLVLVAPASAAAPGAIAMTFEWLEAHGRSALAAGSIMVLNGVSRRSAAFVEQSERVCAGRCRAIVRIPWDDQLQPRIPRRAVPAGPSAQLRQHWTGVLNAATTAAYTALAGVLVASLAAQGGQAQGGQAQGGQAHDDRGGSHDRAHAGQVRP